jgi:hypothetical protein
MGAYMSVTISFAYMMCCSVEVLGIELELRECDEKAGLALRVDALVAAACWRKDQSAIHSSL